MTTRHAMNRRGRMAAGLAAATVAAATVGVFNPIASAAGRQGTGHDLAHQQPIVVDTTNARAVITENPFRLEIQNAAGRTVLAEVPNTSTGSLAVPVTTDPVAPGNDNQTTTTMYEPLSFLVGTEIIQQQTVGDWIGNLESGTRSGTDYHANAVISAERSGDAEKLVLSTTDPSGRRIILTVKPRGPSAIAVVAHVTDPSGVAEFGDSFASTNGEGFFGFGGRHDMLNQHGQVLSSFVNEENLAGKIGPAAGSGGLSMFPNGPDAAYYPQAEFYSSRDYGFLLNQPQLARFKLDADSPAGSQPNAWNVSVVAPSLRYVVAPGRPKRSVDTITSLSGRQPVPPRWALGPMLDRLVKNEGETYDDYQTNLKADLANIKKYRLPLTAYRIEGWGFPTKGDGANGDSNHGLALLTSVHPALQAQVVKALRAKGIHSLFYLRPWLTPGSVPVNKGYAVETSAGKPYYVVGATGSRFGLVDFTNPAAVKWWQRQVKDVFRLGADGFMQDYGEQVLFDMHFHDGSTGVTEHNKYLVQYMKATRGAIDQYEAAHPKRHLWFFNRAGYSGTPGSTKYEGGNFPGDETTDWDRASGIRSLAPDMLNRAVGGAYGYGTDIGGYLDYTTPPTTKELFLRWAEWAALSPIFRLHGSALSGTHTPWSYDAQTVKIYKRLSTLHEKAAPLILRLWRTAERTGAPVTRPLWFQYPRDRKGWNKEQEWLLGPDVLVAPVVTQGATSRSVYLPKGCWQLHSTGRRYQSPIGHSINVHAGLATLPYFLACGSHPFNAK